MLSNEGNLQSLKVELTTCSTTVDKKPRDNNNPKTWWILIQAVFLAKMGYKILFITTEMSTKMVMRRIDAIWCCLNYSLFKAGQLPPDQEKRYYKYLDDQEGREECLVVEQATGGVQQVGVLVDLYNPDKVFIDGAYLLSDEDQDEDNWMATIRVFRGLHKLCLRQGKNIPIEATTQSKDEVGASLKSLQFAKAIAQECDVVAVLEQDEQMKNDKEIRLKPLKLREGDILSSVYMNWDFTAMDYSSIYQEMHAEKASNSKEEAKGVIVIE